MLRLLQPAKLGSLQLQNRVVMAPLSTNFPSVNGEITPEFTAFYLERARGGVGLIIVEWANVDYPLGKSGYTQLRIDDDSYIPSLCQFTEIIHETSTKVCLQLNHAGGMFGDRSRTNLTPISASAVEYGKNHKIARAATIEEIHEVQDKFIFAAERAKMAGFDAIELHGATSYLIANFLSPWTNIRVDEYGGNIENRARFAVEIVEGIRQKCGRLFPILFRISGDEMHPQGRHIDETCEIVNLLKSAGVTCIDVTAGSGKDPKHLARRAHIGPTGYPQGWKSYLAHEVRERCNIPTIAVGSIRDVEVAEAVVQKDADFVAMARQMIADPEWVNKAATGGNIRKCISCNSCVLHRSIYGSKLRCCVNPMAGNEYRLPAPETKPAVKVKKVAIVGAGPAGMEAARVATLRGHKVVLFEKNKWLGGELVPASGADIKYKLRWLTEWLSEELKMLDVDIRRGVEVNGEMLRDSDFDTIIVATGSKPKMFSPVREFYADNKNSEKIIIATDYLAGWRKVPHGAKEALVLGAGSIGQEAAYMLAKGGLHVRLLAGFHTKETMLIGDINNAMELMEAMLKNGVEISDHTKIISVHQKYIEATVFNKPVIMSYDVLVIAQGLIPNDTLLKELEGCKKEIICIGNVVQDRTAFYAIHEGFTAAYNL